MPEDNTLNALSDEQELSSADGQEAASESESVHATLSQALGKEFKDDATALKAVKDTFNMVGSVGQYKKYIDELRTKLGGQRELVDFMKKAVDTGELPDFPQQDDPDKFISREQYEKDNFFAKHPELESNRTIIEALANQTGKPLSEVVELDEIKTLFSKAAAHDEQEKARSVLQSNPRLGRVTDKMAEARQASQEGKHGVATKSAVEAVIDAYDIGG